MLVCLLEGLAGVTVMVDGLASPTQALSTPLNLSEIFSTFENSFKQLNPLSDSVTKGCFAGKPIINFWVPPSLSLWGLMGFSFSSSNLPRRSATQTVLPFFISLYFSSHLYNHSYFITAVIVKKREKNPQSSTCEKAAVVIADTMNQ